MLRQILRLRARPESLTSRARPQLITDHPIEEQTLPRYSPQRYYPVRLGESLKDRYLVVAKLGYGGSSTVWLARDTQAWWWRKNPFVTLKVLTSSDSKTSTAKSELEASRCIDESKDKSEGSRYLRTVMDSFDVTGPHSTHKVLVFEPMRESLQKFQRRMKGGRIPIYFLKVLLVLVLRGLDHLHTNCHLIHTDLKPDNILFRIEKQVVIEEMADGEMQEPTPEKLEGDRKIYLSRNFGDYRGAPGRPKITDFGLAVDGEVSQLHNHPIQADLFQAPEVILRAGWSYSADIWNLGVMLWDLADNRTLFEAIDPTTKSYSPGLHILEMVSLLGPPPKELLKRGEDTAIYFNAEGAPRLDSKLAKEFPTLEGSVKSISGEEKSLFLSFVKRMLRWLPEDRATAAELLQDPWLKA